MNRPNGYREAFEGRLSGILQWERFEAIWAALRDDPEGWHVRDFTARELPDAPMPAEDFRAFLDEAEAFLRRRHREDYCGFLYVDDKDRPTFLKVFDPRKMGSACGCGGAVVPRWTISVAPPRRTREEEAEARARAEKAARPSLLGRLFGRR